MFDKFTGQAQEAIDRASQEARLFNHERVGSEHILLGLVEAGGVHVGRLLEELGADSNKIREYAGQRAKARSQAEIQSPLSFTTRALRALDRARAQASQFGHEEVRSEHILLGLIMERDCRASMVLRSLGVELTTVQEQIEGLFGTNTPPGPNPRRPTSSLDPPEVPVRVKPETPALDHFGADLTKLAHQNKLDPVIGRVHEIGRLIQVLSRRAKNSALLIGQNGVGKTAVVEGLAQAVVAGKVPDSVAGKRIVSLRLESVVSGTKYRGQFEERIKAVINEVRRARDVILFIDEFHSLFSTLDTQGAIDATNVLRPTLLTGELQCIGATTWGDYRRLIANNRALEAHLQTISVEPPNKEETLAILTGLRDRYELHHQVRYGDDALKAAVDYSVHYITSRFLPDKAIDVLDEAGARVRLRAMTPPPEIKEMELVISRLEKQLEEAGAQSDRTQGLRDQVSRLQKRKTELQEKWQHGIGGQTPVINAEIIADTVAKMTGLGVPSPASWGFLDVEVALRGNVVGQDQAIAAVARVLRRTSSGLRSPSRPIGSFVFLGPRHVGKTHLAKQLARFMFGTEEAIIRIDMSQYADRMGLSQLIGAPPGQAAQADGRLLEAIRARPSSVVLLNEIEKAHPDILNKLPQVMREGQLTDALGMHTDFRSVILIMSSHVGAEISNEASMGFETTNSRGDAHRIRSRIKLEVDRYFPRDFLRAADELIFFEPLDPIQLESIIDIQLCPFLSALRSRGIDVELTESARGYLARYRSLHKEEQLSPDSQLMHLLRNRIADALIITHLDRSRHLILDSHPSPGGITELRLTAGEDWTPIHRMPFS